MALWSNHNATQRCQTQHINKMLTTYEHKHMNTECPTKNQSQNLANIGASHSTILLANSTFPQAVKLTSISENEERMVRNTSKAILNYNQPKDLVLSRRSSQGRTSRYAAEMRNRRYATARKTIRGSMGLGNTEHSPLRKARETTSNNFIRTYKPELGSRRFPIVISDSSSDTDEVVIDLTK